MGEANGSLVVAAVVAIAWDDASVASAVAVSAADGRVEIVGIVHNPGGLWMAQSARNLVDAYDGHAERFVLTIKSECLNHIVPLGVRHLRRSIRVFVDHYHLERNHQALDNQLITPMLEPANENAPVECHERLGGLLKHYSRAA